MPENPDQSDEDDRGPDDAEGKYLDIPVTGRRWAGLVAYILLFAAVALVIVILLIYLDTPVPMAIIAVAVMIAGMSFMAYLARRHTL